MKKITGHDSAIMGVMYDEFDGFPPRLAYNVDIIISNLMDDGMTEEDADEFLAFNITGAYVGKDGPIFITPTSLEDIDETDWSEYD